MNDSKCTICSRKSMLSFLTVILAVFVSPIFAQGMPTSTNEIKIGAVLGLTGASQGWSDFARKGLELAASEINDTGGINGKQIKLLLEDAQTIPAKSVTAYQKLVNIDKVKIVIGNVWEFTTSPMVPLTQRDGTLLITPTAMPESLQQRSPTFYTMGERSSSIATAVDSFFTHNPDVKRVGIIYWDDPWGQSYEKQWTDAATRHGAEVVFSGSTSDFATDYRAEMLKIGSKKVDAVFVAHLVEVAIARMLEQGLKVKVLTTSNIIEPLISGSFTKQLFNDVYFTDWQPNARFIEAFTSKFGAPPALEAHNSYEALYSVAKALKINESDPASSIKTVSYEGVAGAINFSDPVTANQSVAKLYQVRNGTITEIQ